MSGLRRFRAGDPGWSESALRSLREDGCAVVESVLPESKLRELRKAMYRAQARIRGHIGEERLQRAGEFGVLRLMLRYEEAFFDLLALDAVLELVDGSVGSTAILHLQNGLILPPSPPGDRPDVFQTSFHRDFPRHLNGYLASINTFFAIDEFTEVNGATLLVPGTHQRPEKPDEEWMRRNATPALCPAGSLIVFDSTLWHAAGANHSDRERLAINQQFTRSFIKQQVDYVRALGNDAVLRQPPRVQQLLGWYTRVPASLDEYYVPAERRLYQAGQG